MNNQLTTGSFPNAPIEEELEPVLIESIQSEFQQIEILEHPLYGNQLVIDNDLQISASDHVYNVAMVSPLISHGNLVNAGILGGGDGGVLFELLNASERIGLPLEKITVIEIDQYVVDLSKRYLKELCGDAFSHPKTELIIGDAFQFLDETKGMDAIIYDLTMDPVRKEEDREEYMHAVIARIEKSLQPGGMLSMQVCGEKEHGPSLQIPRSDYLEMVTKQVERYFAGYVLQNVFIPSFEEAWTFLTAQKSL